MMLNDMEKAANAINKRIDNLAKQFGKNNAAYKQLQTMVNANFKGATYTDKAGNLHISRSKKALAKVNNAAAKFEKMFNAPTVNSVRGKAREILAEQGNTNPSKEEINAQVDVMDSAEQVIKDNAYKYNVYADSDLDYAKETLHIEGRRKTWDEINKIVEILKADYNDAEIKEPENEFEDIEGVFR